MEDPGAHYHLQQAATALAKGDTLTAREHSAAVLALGGVRGGYATLAPAFATLPPDLQPLPPSPLLQAWRRAARFLPGKMSFAIGLIAWTLAFIILPIQRIAATLRYSLSAGLIVFGTLFSLMSYTQFTMLRSDLVMLTAASWVYEAPSDQSPSVRRVPAGVIAQSGEVLNGYIALRLPSGQRGWTAIGATSRVLSKD